MAIDESKTYPPTGEWEVYSQHDPNYEMSAPVLVRPDGTIYDSYDPSDGGRSEADSWRLTFNLNPDKGDYFGQCPFCKDGCPWCGM